MKKAVCLLSGGLDSLVALSVAQKKGLEIYPIFIDYGQKTVVQEEKAFHCICDHYNLHTKRVFHMGVMKEIGGSALMSDEIAVDTDTQLKDISTTTLLYVPFRNTILISIATAYAETIGASFIYAGNEPSNYNPDNSIQFVSALQTVIYIGTKKDTVIKLETPWILKPGKEAIIKVGVENNVPFELTWSCHNDKTMAQGIACGVCEKCQFRKQAFERAGINDPIQYLALS